MLTASAFLFLVLNLAPSPALLRNHYAPPASFAVAAAHDAPSSLRGLKNINASNANNANPSFASLVWGNNTIANNSNNAGQATTAHAPPSATTTTDSENNDARHKIHLEMVNSSSWQDPASVTFYQAEYRASNTATRDICDVKIGIPLGDASNVSVNDSYAMKIDSFSMPTANRGSGEQGPMLMAMLQPPYFRPGVRIREAVDMGFVLQSATNPGIAGTGQATVLSARYCTEEESRASMAVPNHQQQGQQQEQQQGQQQGQQQNPAPKQNEQESEAWPVRAANLIQQWRQGGGDE